ncbi:MAG: S8 family serine peptidase [Candidatus Kerfeldbacteria bacterium]|nr:S8 family serine peptidase [Candidatus Kerfeldbacteria bacterium]
MIQLFSWRATFIWLVVALALIVSAAPLRAVTNQPDRLWQSTERTVQSYDASRVYATDHIIVKKVTGEVERVAVVEGATVESTLDLWANDPTTAFAEPDGLVRALAQETSWGWTTLQAGEAATTNGATGAGVIVAVVDTGVDYNHEDLDANNWVNTDESDGNNVDNDSNGFVDDALGYDFIGSLYTAVTPDNDPQDEHGHGTHVAGIIAAENNTVGTRGVAPSATIMPVKVLDSEGVGFDSTVADGIRYAVDNGADIINLSLGSSFASNTVKEAVDYAETNGVLVIAAAGNSGTFSGLSYPAGYSNVISVAASNEDGYKAYYSNWGKIDVIAPGDDILSTTPGNTYDRYSGTSMAAPHVAGLAALIQQKQGLTNIYAIRHALETTTDDFGTQVGPDYVTGQGMVNALSATGTLPTEALVYADSGTVVADSSDLITIYASVRTAAGVAVTGDTVTWSTTKGTVSASTSTTNANGIASITITADDVAGLAVVTADATTAAAATMQFAILDDTVQPENIGVSPYTEGEEELVEEGTDEENSDEVTLANASSATSLSTNVYSAGDKLVAWSYPFARDRLAHDVTMTYSVTDPAGTAVADLSGTSEEVTVGQLFWGIFFVPQTRITSKPLTIPTTAATGEYTLTVTINDVDSNETATRTTNFWVNDLPDLLLVDNMASCGDTPVEGWDLGGWPACSRAGHVLADELTALGYTVMLWNTTDLGYPTVDDLKLFSAVIWADAGLTAGDSYTLQTYLEAGGNVLLTSEQTASYNDYSTPTDFLWNYLHARRVSTLFHPDAVVGVADGVFTGESFNMDFFDLNGDGAHTSFYADELELNEADEAEAILSYNVGQSTAKTAGVRVDNDTYRAAYLGFGLESINDGSDNATKAYVLTTLLDWLLGDKPTISTVSPTKVANNIDRTITITGDNFSVVGTTVVKLGNTRLSSVTVLNRQTIQAIVPAGTTAKQYKVKVINPNDQRVGLANGLRVTKGAPMVDSATPGYASNNVDRVITLAGQNFKASSKVFLGKQRLHNVTFDNANQLQVTIPKGFTVGQYVLKVKSSSGKVGTLADDFTVRYGFTEEWTSGASAAGVLALERRLHIYGYFNDTPDNDFTATTSNALLQFQHSQAITETGVTDFLTRYYLNINQ